MTSKIITLISALSFAGSAFAGGSISREDATREVCAESENLCILLRNIDLSLVGSAVRMPDGSRIMPFQFNAEIGGYPTWVVMNRDEKGHIVLEIR